MPNYNNSNKKQFLKRPLDIADYIEQIPIQTTSQKEINLYDYITDHLLLFAFSTDCVSCLTSLETLYEFAKDNDRYNIVMLVHSNEEESHIIIESFKDVVSQIHIVDKTMLTKRLRIKQMPRGYCVNKLGQVLSHYNCFDQYWINKLVEPLQNVVQNKAEVQ